MSTTQEHLSIKDIRDDIVLLKDGGGALVLQTSAVNFGLLSEREQIAIISAFAQMLNSLSFSIQIVVRSERLDITSYLTLLDQALKKQTNPLLAQIMRGYSNFIQATIKENEVLDKSFYIIIPLFRLELGISSSDEILERKIRTILLPRRDQILRQLGRIGLRANQLTGEKLLKLFYDIYNQTEEVLNLAEPEPVKLNPPKAVPPKPSSTMPIPPTPIAVAGVKQAAEPNRSRTHPFVVEELEDNV